MTFGGKTWCVLHQLIRKAHNPPSKQVELVWRKLNSNDCHFGKVACKEASLARGESELPFSTYAHTYAGKHQLPLKGSQFGNQIAGVYPTGHLLQIHQLGWSTHGYGRARFTVTQFQSNLAAHSNRKTHDARWPSSKQCCGRAPVSPKRIEIY